MRDIERVYAASGHESPIVPLPAVRIYWRVFAAGMDRKSGSWRVYGVKTSKMAVGSKFIADAMMPPAT